VIRINLLPRERQVKKVAAPLAAGQKLTIACSLILVVAAAGIGWRYWMLRRESAQLDGAIAVAQAETTRLHSIIQQVQQFEQQRAQLQQRVALIEQLRRDQTGPVHMLDQIGRALPPMVWLTRLQQGADANDVTIEGRGTTLTSLSDFVVNLEGSGYFRRSIEIVNTQTTPLRDEAGEIIQFTIRARFDQPEPVAMPVATAGVVPAQATPTPTPGP
jgi:type IV pilus assembly protein PilN